MSNASGRTVTDTSGNPEDDVEHYNVTRAKDFLPAAETSEAYRQRLPEATTAEILCSADIGLLKSCLDEAIKAGDDARCTDLETRIVEAEKFLSRLRRQIEIMQRDLPDLDIEHSLDGDRDEIAQIEAERLAVYEGVAAYRQDAMKVAAWLARLKAAETRAKAFVNKQERKKTQFPDVERPTLGPLELSISAAEPNTGSGNPRKPDLWQRFVLPRVGRANDVDIEHGDHVWPEPQERVSKEELERRRILADERARKEQDEIGELPKHPGYPRSGWFDLNRGGRAGG